MNLQTWFVDALEQLFPEDAAYTDELAKPSFSAARNSTVSIQLAARSQIRLEGVTAEIVGLAETIERIRIKVRRVGYVYVPLNTPPENSTVEMPELIHSAPALFPDILLEESSFEFAADTTQSLWFSLEISGDAAPGEYQAEVIVRHCGKEIARRPFSLRVMQAVVPEQQTLRYTNWLYLGDEHIRPFFEIEYNTEAWWELVEKLARIMYEGRQNVFLTPLTRSYFTPQPCLIGARAGLKGIEYDFTNFDRWVEIFHAVGMHYIEGGHVLNHGANGMTVDAYILENGAAALKSIPNDDPLAEAVLRPMLVALYRHLREKGWENRYYQHILDEPKDGHIAIYEKYVGIVRDIMPGIPILDAVYSGKGTRTPISDIWVPMLGTFDNNIEVLQQHIDRGQEVWFYTANIPRGLYPNRFLDFVLIKTRLLPWINFHYGLTGFLHWGGNFWAPLGKESAGQSVELSGNGNPWIVCGVQDRPPGNGFLVYPDPQNKGFLGSIRLEAHREGIEDYELLRTLAEKDPDAAQQIASAVIQSCTEYVRDVKEFRRWHVKLLETISKERQN